jgi:hypothetical protein
MTIGSIISLIIGGIVLIGGVALGIVIINDGDTGIGTLIIVTSLLLAIALIVTPIVYMNTETGKRALKDQKSNFGSGMNRVVEVYDVSGEIIKTYEGKFDVEVSNESGSPYILFDDEKGKRHIIYYTTGTIIVDEK